MLQPPENDWKFWQWALGGVCTFIAGMGGGVWAVRGKYDALVAAGEDHEKRIKKVEEAMAAISDIKVDVSYIKGVIDEKHRSNN